MREESYIFTHTHTQGSYSYSFEWFLKSTRAEEGPLATTAGSATLRLGMWLFPSQSILISSMHTHVKVCVCICERIYFVLEKVCRVLPSSWSGKVEEY